jgi:hypothetical protein
LKSTNGASDSQRKSYRDSFKLGDGADLVCRSHEQRVAWEKLMSEGAMFNDSHEVVVKEHSPRVDTFSNAQALAALEFGTSEFDQPRMI